ncbi:MULTISPECIES: type II toxin-antitoxin system Phd/YefM family antitoxin [unclassified Roseivivax]|uniref:type II toxin-antitoxin system Phd/YefM family antitoxin n=1 Tax=Roseivivax sp. GX 12232 TaxID=2900547 RepID=UPI001E64F4B2|nr:plasmid stabilization protein [Roseivivax sp. GX 12232]MCE0506864.1 plasmid stabilization protein [Roseivivax sp. GX 12232]
MPAHIQSGPTASITEFKRNPMALIGEEPLAVLNHNAPAFYAVPADLFDEIMDRLEDAELNALADARAGGEEVSVSLDEL